MPLAVEKNKRKNRKKSYKKNTQNLPEMTDYFLAFDTFMGCWDGITKTD